ncbi:MAG: pyrroline-5-carboxylate reductase [Bacteroidetes bacterium]|jgi:pyrroline-5-carboxylate reductase|nr:pyrroline-5-carboxylate reductase [Bacteroidota bacterium]
MLHDKTIGVIGAGHIGNAVIGGLLRAKLTSPKNIFASRKNSENLEELTKTFGVHVTTDNKKVARSSQILILAVKPMNAKEVLNDIKEVVSPSHLIISVMAGIRTSFINSFLEVSCPVIRSMPNTPVLVDAGATAISKGNFANDEHLKIAHTIFKSVGTVEVVPESLLDAVTGLSGSGPAYIYMVIEAMTDGGVKMGIPRQIAFRLAAQTVFGASKLVIETGKHPAILKDEVTTPGGTAIAAVHELETHGLRTMLINAVSTATVRSKELSKIIEENDN